MAERTPATAANGPGDGRLQGVDVPENTDTTPTAAVLTHCCVCEIRLLGGTAVAVVETGSGPSRTLRACGPCVKQHNILPLDEQDTLHGDGRLRFRGQ